MEPPPIWIFRPAPIAHNQNQKVHMALTMLDRPAGLSKRGQDNVHMMRMAPVFKGVMSPAQAVTPTPCAVHAALRSPSAAFVKYPAAQSQNWMYAQGALQIYV